MSERLDPGDRRPTERADERFGSAIREPHTSDAGIRRELLGTNGSERGEQRMLPAALAVPMPERRMRRNAQPRGSRLRGIDRAETMRTELPRQQADLARRCSMRSARVIELLARAKRLIVGETSWRGGAPGTVRTPCDCQRRSRWPAPLAVKQRR